MFLDIIEHIYMVFGPFLTRPRSVWTAFLILFDHLQHLFKAHRRHQDLIGGVLS